ncbi:MAG TPA: MaoC family dehydratase [Burkholderiaceae bacterium]|nr:MaoC family dehydratase [Burkholderiaceae bacterium]
MAQPKWYFEDFKVGDSVEIGSRTVTEEEIIAFATQFDPQPFHVDPDAAAQSIFGGIIASGWHTCSMMMRLMVDGFLNNSSSMGSPGVDQLRWLKPVRAGDTLRLSLVTLEATPSSSKPDRGVVVTEWRATNQHGELVLTIKGLGMFGRRPAKS